MKKAIFPILTLMLFLTWSCKKEPQQGYGGGGNGGATINPSDANKLTSVLVVPGGNTVNGSMPSSSSTPTAPVITVVDPTVSYSAGSQINLPIQFSASSGTDVCGVYFQVNGAGSYFNVPITATNNGVLVLPINIPSNVASGNFCITVSVYNCNSPSEVSNTFVTCVTVTQPLACSNSQLASGGEGVTSTLHNLGQTAGYVNIEYETFTVPDRIDVFYGGLWVAGTGSNPGPTGSVPPLADCSNPTNGYVGENSSFCFYYDPATMGAQVEVVVSGCVRGGTIWNYTIHCPTSTICPTTPTTSQCGVQTVSGGQGTTTTHHILGSQSGTVNINYNMNSIPDEMTVFYQGQVVASTGGPVSNSGTLSFNYVYSGADFITVVVVGTDANTGWDYLVDCPL